MVKGVELLRSNGRKFSLVIGSTLIFVLLVTLVNHKDSVNDPLVEVPVEISEPTETRGPSTTEPDHTPATETKQSQAPSKASPDPSPSKYNSGVASGVPSIKPTITSTPTGTDEEPMSSDQRILTSCSAPQGTSCSIKLIHEGTGRVVRLPTKIIDSTGTASWEWNPSNPYGDTSLNGGRWSILGEAQQQDKVFSSTALMMYVKARVKAL